MSKFIEKRKNLYYVILLAVGFFCQIEYRFLGISWFSGLAVWFWVYAFTELTFRFRGKRELIVTGIVFCLAYFLKNSGSIGVIWWELLLFMLVGAFGYGIFLLSAFLSLRWKHPANTLILPFFWTVAYFLATLLRVPSLMRLDVFFTDMNALIQTEHYIGSFGLTFMMLWIVTLVRYSIANRKVRATILAAGVYVALTLTGVICLYPNVTPAQSVSVAYTTGPYAGDFINYTAPSYDTCVSSMENSVREASRQGAEILVFNEEAFEMDDADEAAFLEECSRAAEENSVALIVGLDISSSESGAACRNELVCIGQDGEVLGSYEKTHPIPLVEAEYEAGDGDILTLTLDLDGTPVKISCLICYDSNFPGFLEKMDRDTDILFLPSWDWKEVTQLHAHLTCALAAQYRVSILKPTYDGLSIAVDPDGSIFYSSSTDDTGFETVRTVEMPLRNSAGTTYTMPSLLPYIHSILSVELFSFIICTLLLIGCLTVKVRSKRNRWFSALLGTNMLALAADAMSWLLDGCTRLNTALYVSTEISMLMTLFLLSEFIAYVLAYIRESHQISSRPLYFSVAASVVAVMVTFIFSAAGKLFTFESGTYADGPLYFVYILLNIAAMAVCLAVIYIYSRSMNRRGRVASYLYLAFPIVCALINMFDERFSYAYPAITLSLVVVYVMIQSDRMTSLERESAAIAHQATHDEMTGLQNRRAYTDRLDRMDASSELLSVLFGDLNGLKYENDHFGHEAGDRKLIRFADLLTGVFRRDEVYRISGDEFVVLSPGIDPELFEQRAALLRKKLDEAGNALASVGTASGTTADANELVKTAETRMYKEKEAYRRWHPERVR